MPATEAYLRDIKKVHVVFALSSIALFATTIWMTGSDHSREWTGHQRTFEQIQARKQEAEIASIESSPQYEKTRDDLAKKLEAAKQAVAAVQPQKSKLTAELAVAEREFDASSRLVRGERAIRDKARADYDLAIRDSLPQARLDSLIKNFNDAQTQVDAREIEVQQKETTRNDFQRQIKAIMKTEDATAAEIAKLNADIDLRTKALEKLAPQGFSDFKKTIMEWPIIDGFNSPLKITQDWLPNLTIQLGMARTARFDRCRSCHVGIDRVETGNVASFPFGGPSGKGVSEWVAENKFPHPYATHPRPELYLTAASPHSLEKFGCTICHDGQGSGTSFTDASHTPNDPHKDEVWHRQHHYASNHFWEYPMTPERLREATCLKCHHSVVELGIHPKFGASAPKLFKGYALIKDYGCFGCHEIHGFDGTKPIGPDLRLEPSADAVPDPTQVAGTLRKVGPSLRHIRSKTTAKFVSFWTEDPKWFRPATRMPQFFHQTNLQDARAEELQPVELTGIAHYLVAKSERLDLLAPEKGYAADAARGKELFSKRGCLACHSHEAFADVKADFGPNLSRVHAKIRPDQDGFKWLYTWVREPERHHPRTRMPNLYLESYEEAGKRIDPAADIAAFLLEKGPEEFPLPKLDDDALNKLVMLHLSKALKEADAEKVLKDRVYPIPRAQVKGDEIELIAAAGTKEITDAAWRGMKLNYVGRRTISRYGCFGCHDIPNFETARPIGTALQDWGRKDTSRLAPEHIEEYLHHHGEPDGSSTHDRVAKAVGAAQRGGTAAGEFKGDEEEREMRVAYFYENLAHHGRAGFLWQKLRDPRSYDYKKIETKGYDERLRMPKFSFNEEQIEAIANFVLGLVADPPAKDYLYRPDGPAKARIEGERMIDRYNCAGCHMLEMPEIRHAADLAQIAASEFSPADHPAARELLMKLKPPENGATGRTIKIPTQGGSKELPEVRFHGLIVARPDPADPLEDQEFAYDLWGTLDVAGKILVPGDRRIVKRTDLTAGANATDGYSAPARGGAFAEWLVERLMATVPGTDRGRAWQMSPPPLYKEGIKVQTPWLYQFLREPNRLRHTTVLRMPRFNMSSEEAQTLANYFAAVDGEPFPYQNVPQRDPAYWAATERKLEQFLAPTKTHYLAESWKVLNAPLCIKCHSVGGREYKAVDPVKDVRGPNLEFAADRLRPDWLMLWLYKPSWLTPYTSMPAPLPKDAKQFEELFGGNAGVQTVALRDALMNYHRLMELEGKTVVETAPPKAPATSSRPAAGGEE